MTRLLRGALLILLALVVAGCQVDGVLEVDVNDDGSGVVTASVGLDDEALARTPDLADRLRTDDLEQAGWTVTGPDEQDGMTWFRASKPFATPDEGVETIQEVTGPDGILKQIDLSRSKAFSQTDYDFSASADFSGGVAALSDQGITDLLGDPVGGNVSDVEAETGVPATNQVDLTVKVDLPGAEPAVFDLDPAQTGRQPIATSSSTTNWSARLLLLAAVLLLVLAIVLAVMMTSRNRRRRRAEAEREAALAAASADEGPTESTGAPQAPEAPARRLEVVILDGQGVVFDTGIETVDMLGEFAHDHGSPVSARKVETEYLGATRGQSGDAGLWEALGVDGDPAELTDTFLVGHRITPGLRPFLERMAQRDLTVVVAINEVSEFARKLRRTHKLEGLTKEWVVSSDVGARLPDRRVFDECLRVTGVQASNCFFIGRDRPMLEAARNTGMAAAWFHPRDDAEAGDDATDEAVTQTDDGFPVIRSFEDLGIGEH